MFKLIYAPPRNEPSLKLPVPLCIFPRSKCAAIAADDALFGDSTDGLGVPRLARHVREVQQIIYYGSALFIKEDFGKPKVGKSVIYLKQTVVRFIAAWKIGNLLFYFTPPWSGFFIAG